MIFWQLFYGFFIIGLLNFGGGYAMIYLIQNTVVTNHAWITAAEFTNMIAVAQATPGPLAINTATYAGYKVAGVSGAIFANLGLLCPALLIITLLAGYLIKHEQSPVVQGILSGLRPVTIGLILASALSLGYSNIVSFATLLLTAAGLFLSLRSRLHPAVIILGLGFLGMFIV